MLNFLEYKLLTCFRLYCWENVNFIMKPLDILDKLLEILPIINKINKMVWVFTFELIKNEE